MIREIKFRAWIESQNYMAIQGTPDLETLQSFMFHYGNEKTLMQYTGLKDKNGKEIYEGDIVIPFSDFEKGNRSVVVYEFNQFRIKGKNLYWSWASDIEVIGNIYENPKFTQSSE
jgi:uncharacterized phage protein (TIGR01671 family)